ncbi:MAG: PQQ-binding-like beta-propeller repeat protein [Phycisphaerales bacterium]|nr:PQQ-binding-like beta-propeller repeat protein [Phycisphaerales bacterium]
MTSRVRALVGPGLGLAVCLAGPAMGQGWSNSGGNAGRNGLTGELGPDAADLLWSGGRPSTIAWQPVIDGRTVYAVRQTGFPPEPNSDESPVVAQDLDTGQELWFRHIPFETGDWTTWIAGAKDGLVFVCRGGNGSTSSARIYALDGATGATVWISEDEVAAGAYDGVVFAPDGDLLVGDFRFLYRVDFDTGETVWQVSRVCSVSSSCGPASSGAAVYIADAIGGGHVIKRMNLASGAMEYQSPVMAGFTLQNTPMVGPDGKIFLSRTQNNAAVDYFFAFEDAGGSINQLWSQQAGWTTTSEFCVGPDGSVYMVGPGMTIQRRDAATGQLLDESVSVDADFLTPRMAADRDGRVFFSNGSFNDGRFYSFDADLTLRWDVAVTNVNIGAPAIGPDGTLIVCGVGTDVRAYRTDRCVADFNGDGGVNTQDVLAFLNAWVAGDARADINGDGSVNTQDVLAYLNLWVAGC